MAKAETITGAEGEWIEHDGGECPVQSTTLVDIRTRQWEYESLYAGAIHQDRWTHGPEILPLGHIIAYRVVRP